MHEELFNLGFILIFIGFAFCFLSVILLIIKSMLSKNSKALKGGGAILIGPIPIIFGTDKEMFKIAIILVIIVIIVFALISFYTFFK